MTHTKVRLPHCCTDMDEAVTEGAVRAWQSEPDDYAVLVWRADETWEHHFLIRWCPFCGARVRVG